MPVKETEIRIWKALADPTRRSILDELRRQPLPTGQLSQLFPLTRYGVMKHLTVLVEAGLVLVERRGRERWNHVNPAPIRSIYRRWIRPFEEDSSDKLLLLKQHAEREAPQGEPAMSQTQSPLNAIEVLVEVEIEATPEKVWKALVEETAQWWHPAYSTNAAYRKFVIEPELGGFMGEDWGNGDGQVWGRVNGLQKNRFLQVVGDQSKDFDGPSRGIMTWRLEAEGSTTRVRFEQSLFGRVTDKTRSSLEGGWTQLFRDCLKFYAENDKSPDFEGMEVQECGA